MRIDGKQSDHDAAVTEAFAQQEATWGAELSPYHVYARRPTIFSAVIGMWNGLAESGLLPGSLTTLVNRRVAALNGCVF